MKPRRPRRSRTRRRSRSRPPRRPRRSRTDQAATSARIESSSGRRFLHKDHQGSVIALSDNAGNAVAINKYDEYGIPAAGNAGRFGYTGQIWIPELGLWHYKARAYSPILGRFLQVDPVGYDDQINLYAYVGNDPTNSRDPTGATCTQDQDKGSWSCKIDDVPEGTDPKLVARLEKAYTTAVNAAMSNPNRVVTANVKPPTGTRLPAQVRTTQGEIGRSLATREVSISSTQPKGFPVDRARTPGQPGDKNNPVATIVYPRGLNSLTGTPASQRMMTITFLHEGIHGTVSDIAVRRAWEGVASFERPHQAPYQSQAEGILQCSLQPEMC